MKIKTSAAFKSKQEKQEFHRRALTLSQLSEKNSIQKKNRWTEDPKSPIFRSIPATGTKGNVSGSERVLG